MTEPLLQLAGVSAGYGNQTDALSDIDIRLDEGDIHGIIGANGAGKSTLLKVLGGVLSHGTGEIRYAGETLSPNDDPARRLRMGLCLLPEGHRVIPTLTVRENLSLATIGSWPRGHRAQIARNIDFVHDLFPVLDERRRQLAGHLSGGEQQMVSIGRAIMSEPRVLLLDEPSLGLAPAIVDRIYTAIGRIAEGGLSFVIVEQNHSRLKKICNQIDILSLGGIVYSAPTGQIDDETVERAYFGERRADSDHASSNGVRPETSK